jgi:hypothetical protein
VQFLARGNGKAFADFHLSAIAIYSHKAIAKTAAGKLSKTPFRPV